MKKIIITIIITLILAILTSLTTFIGGHKLKFMVCFISFPIYLYIIIRKSKNMNLLFLIILSTYILFNLIILTLGGLKFYMVSNLSTLSGVLGLFWGFLLIKYIKNKPKLYTTFIIGLLFLVWIEQKGYNLWIHKVNYGTFTGISSQKLDREVFLYNTKRQNTLSLKKTNKLILLDFWNTHCGACFKKFPILNKFSENNKDLLVYAVNVPYKKENLGHSEDLLRKRNYSFNNLFISNKDARYLGISIYPITIVILNNNIIFKGSIEYAIKFIEDYK